MYAHTLRLLALVLLLTGLTLSVATASAADNGGTLYLPMVAAADPHVGTIVFSDSGTIKLISTSGSPPVTITEPADQCCPTWSPDNKTIYFFRTTPQGEAAYAVEKDGSNLRHLFDIPAGYFRDQWAPNHTKLALYTSDYPDKIYLIDADGSNLKRLTTGNEADFFGQWSPDSSRIVFSRLRPKTVDKPSSVNIVDVNSRNLTLLSKHLYDTNSFVWSPDGTQVAFMARDSLTQPHPGDIYVVNANGSGLRNITANHAGAAGLDLWSPDGSRILYRDGNDLYSMNAADGSDPQVVALGVGFNLTWTAGGKKLVFVDSYDSGQSQCGLLGCWPNPYYDLHVMDADGSNRKRLTYEYKAADIDCTP